MSVCICCLVRLICEFGSITINDEHLTCTENRTAAAFSPSVCSLQIIFPRCIPLSSIIVFSIMCFEKIFCSSAYKQLQSRMNACLVALLEQSLQQSIGIHLCVYVWGVKKKGKKIRAAVRKENESIASWGCVWAGGGWAGYQSVTPVAHVCWLWLGGH